MTQTKTLPENIDDKLATLKYKCDETSHLNPTASDCAVCEKRPCTTCCPANVYEWHEAEEKLGVGFENCLECGACRVVCPARTLGWTYPKSGLGVTFKYG